MNSQPNDYPNESSHSVIGIFRDVTGKPFNESSHAIRILNAMFAENDFLSVNLPIARLNATQSTVNANFTEASQKYTVHDKDRMPAVVKYEDQYYVTDGHHRIMAMAAQGMSQVPVRLYDLDGNTQTFFPLLDTPDVSMDSLQSFQDFRQDLMFGLTQSKDHYWINPNWVVTKNKKASIRWEAIQFQDGVPIDSREFTAFDALVQFVWTRSQQDTSLDINENPDDTSGFRGP
jgi:Putative ParB-like nuclease